MMYVSLFVVACLVARCGGQEINSHIGGTDSTSWLECTSHSDCDAFAEYVTSESEKTIPTCFTDDYASDMGWYFTCGLAECYNDTHCAHHVDSNSNSTAICYRYDCIVLECMSDADCATLYDDKPACYTKDGDIADWGANGNNGYWDDYNTCVECMGDSDCATGCNLDTRTCEECTSDEDCSGNSNGAVCLKTYDFFHHQYSISSWDVYAWRETAYAYEYETWPVNTCVECGSENGCTEGTWCDPATFTCADCSAITCGDERFFQQSCPECGWACNPKYFEGYNYPSTCTELECTDTIYESVAYERAPTSRKLLCAASALSPEMTFLICTIAIFVLYN